MTPVRPLQRTALQLTALLAQLGQLQIAIARNGGEKPPGFDVLMAESRAIVGWLGVEVQSATARQAFEAR